MRKRDLIGVAACAVVFGLVGGVSFEGVSYVYNQVVVGEESSESDAVATEAKTVASTTTTTTSSTDGSVSEVAENVLPSIVAIDVTVTETTSDMFGRTYEQDSEGSGSGIIVAQDEKYLYIVTNNHVVSDATKVSVTFNDESIYDATVKGTDSDSDLAVVQVLTNDLSSDTLSNIKVATLGDSDDVSVGDQAIAIGNALGYGTSVTVGYISAKDREVASEDVTMKLIQTDAAINPGNSGGALVNSAGAVIGINSSKYADTDVEGMGFAIPISTAVPIINEIIESEEIDESEQGYLGITGQEVDEQYAEYYNIPEGVYVAEVSESSPAEEAGMQAGDVITELDGKTITTMTGLQEKLSKLKAGTEVTVVVKRLDNGEYKEVELNVTLGSKS
ncbi:MAG: trypsin-like peptidase domain-containing protein [Clostridiaceae bacterium]|nr:trypsin-like peptidase domain-containing protein [Clostridiaceae bacterium]